MTLQSNKCDGKAECQSVATAFVSHHYRRSACILNSQDSNVN